MGSNNAQILKKGHTFACRACDAEVSNSFVNLGMTPLCQNRVEPEDLNLHETYYPLHAYLCDSCMLVQLDEYVSPDQIFSDYAYFSSFSTSWVEHARRYVDMAVERFGLGEESQVYEIASNDGYLLQHFVAKNVPCTGVEPAANVAEAAVAKNIPTEVMFFGTESAKTLAGKHGQADLILGNNVLAHVPKLNDFIAGMKLLLKPDGAITMEFPHLLQLMKNNQYDTIYHEHFSYLAFFVVANTFKRHGLEMFDVETIPTHGGSIRIFAQHEGGPREAGPNVAAMLEQEKEYGLMSPEAYKTFAEQVRNTKRRLLEFLIKANDEGKSVVGYGAPGKGNTLLNYCGIGTDLLEYTVDLSPHKNGRYTPGSRIPIYHPDRIKETKPDYVLILPWNLEKEITQQHDYVREWGGQFVVPIPDVRLC